MTKQPVELENWLYELKFDAVRRRDLEGTHEDKKTPVLGTISDALTACINLSRQLLEA